MTEESETSERPGAERWVVERVDERVAVLVLDSGDELPVVVEVAVELLGEGAVPGAALDVPLGEVGQPDWEEASIVTPEDAG